MHNKGKKTCVDFGKRKKVRDKLLSFIDQQLHQSQLQQQIQSFQQYLCSHDLHSYFHQLHLHLRKEMVQIYKKNVLLPDGIFILVEGSATYVWTKNKNDRNLRDHLFSLSKMGTYSNLEGQYEKGNFLSTGYSIYINSSFAVIESENGNICTNEETLVLQIPPSTLELTNFFPLKNERLDYFTKAKFPFSRVFSSQPCVQINYNLHHTFKKKNYLFRNKFEVDSLAVVTDGSFYFRSSNSKSKQGSSYSLLLPGYQYEVSSSFLQLIDIIDNPTIVLRKAQALQNINKNKRADEPRQTNELRSLCNKISNSVSFYKNKKGPEFFGNKEQKKKKKDYSLFLKDNQQYWIVSSELSKQNLDKLRIKRKNIENQSKDAKKNILFPVSKKQFKAPICNTPTSKQLENKLKISCPYSSLSNSKTNLLCRYEVYAKEVFGKFKKFQQKQFQQDEALALNQWQSPQN